MLLIGFTFYATARSNDSHAWFCYVMNSVDKAR